MAEATWGDLDERNLTVASGLIGASEAEILGALRNATHAGYSLGYREGYKDRDGEGSYE